MHSLLFTTTTCPKCPAFKAFVAERVHFPVEILNETMPQFSDKIGEYGVTNAPTLIVFDDEGKEIFRGSEVYEVEDFLKKHS